MSRGHVIAHFTLDRTQLGPVIDAIRAAEAAMVTVGAERDALAARVQELENALRAAQHWHEQLDYDEALNVIDSALDVKQA